MSLDERSYGGRLFRPTPEVHLEEDGSFGVVATPWGNRSSAKKVIDTLKDYVLSARQDMEATSPFQKLSSISPLANNLRVGLMLANDLVYREDNKAEYTAGIEVLVFAHHEGELSLAQVGAPSVFIARAGQPWIPLGVQSDLSTEMSVAQAPLSPLPQNMIGLHTTTNMNISSFKTQPGDRLVLLSHSIPSHAMFAIPFEKTGLERISATLSAAYPELPFWCGVHQIAG